MIGSVSLDALLTEDTELTAAGVVLLGACGRSKLIQAKEALRQIHEQRLPITVVTGLDTCVWLDGSVVSIRFDGSTCAWPPGNALWDVQLVDQTDQVRMTETVEMLIERSVTAAGG